MEIERKRERERGGSKRELLKDRERDNMTV